MATDTYCATSVLDEAAAIVEAEWIRLQHDSAPWDHEVADPTAKMLAPRPCPPHVGVTTARRRPSSQPMPDDRRRPPRRWLPEQVWATQRSPPRRWPSR